MLRALVLEDHDDLRFLMRSVLEDAGYRVQAFSSTEEAEAVLETCDVDVALLDVHLPGKSGDAFARELHEQCPEAHIVFTTADAAPERLKRVIPGCTVLSKPFQFNTMLELLGTMN